MSDAADASPSNAPTPDAKRRRRRAAEAEAAPGVAAAGGSASAAAGSASAAAGDRERAVSDGGAAEIAWLKAELAAERAAKEAERAAKEAKEAELAAKDASTATWKVAANLERVHGLLIGRGNQRSTSRSRSQSHARSSAPDASSTADAAAISEVGGVNSPHAQAEDEAATARTDHSSTGAGAEGILADDADAGAVALEEDAATGAADTSAGGDDRVASYGVWEMSAGDRVAAVSFGFTDLAVHKSALEALTKTREDNAVKLDELAHTQPFVNRVLRDVRAQFTVHREGQKLFLYQERSDGRNAENVVGAAGSAAETNRRPDAAFFMRDSAAKGVKFDRAAQKSALLTVEAKRCLDDSLWRAALHEVERDFAEVSGGLPKRKMRKGFSVITSGFEWRFVCMWWTVDSHNAWKRKIEVSEKIVLTPADDDSWTKLGQWFHFALTEAIQSPDCQTGLPTTAEFGGQSYALDAVLGVGERSVVSRWALSSSDENVFVLKVPALVGGEGRADRKTKLDEYFMREQNNLATLAKKIDEEMRFFPKLLPMLPIAPTTALMLSDEGIALSLLDICGAAGRQLALVVKRDIWIGALKALKALGLRHCDIYATNIVVAGAGDARKAKLIDWESAGPVDLKELTHSPTHTPEVDHKEMSDYDARCTASVLFFLWDNAASSFDRRVHVEHVESGQISEKPFDKFVDEVVVTEESPRVN